MALVSTTLAAAYAVGDNKITVASATSIAAGRFVRIDGEFFRVTSGYVSGSVTVPVFPGQEGTASVAHPITAEVTHGEPQDFGRPGAGTSVNVPPAGVARQRVSYSASGAIALPAPGVDVIAELNGTSVLVMTLADPDEAISGSSLKVIANGAAAHTVTSASGFGGAGASYNVLTFDGSGQAGFEVVASNGVWVLMNQVDGTLTRVATSIA